MRIQILIIFVFVGDASLQQPPCHEYTTKHTMSERVHIQLGVAKEHPKDEKVELDNSTKKYLAASKNQRNK